MLVTANEYLDARKREWLTQETFGSVRYDTVTHMVSIADRERAIISAVVGERPA